MANVANFGFFYAHSGPKVPGCRPIHISMHLKFFNRIYKKCSALKDITSPTIIILTAEKLPKIKRYPGSGPLGPDSQLKNCPWLKSDASFGISTPKLVTEQMQNKFPSVFYQQTVYLTIYLKITSLPLPSPIGLTLQWYHHLQVDPSSPNIHLLIFLWADSDSS